MRLTNTAACAVLAVAVAVTTFGLVPFYPGSPVALMAFGAGFGTALALAFAAPVSIGYLCLAGFLFLGFWLKLAAHLTFGYTLIEPTGSFLGQPDQWDRALEISAVAAAGLSVSRILMLRRLRVNAGGTLDFWGSFGLFHPTWYARSRIGLWTFYAIALLGLCVANYYFAFYQVGVHTKLLLPWRLHVIPTWLINIGLALGLAVLVSWEASLRPANVKWLAAAILLQGLLVSSSSLSRSMLLMQAAPALVVLAVSIWPRDRRTATRLIAALTLFALTLAAAVTVLRLEKYPNPLTYSGAAGGDCSDKRALGALEALRSSCLSDKYKTHIRLDIIEHTAGQISNLLIGRWVGLEGTLTVASNRDNGWPLLLRAARENPGTGAAAIYQEMARADSYQRYSKAGEFTFLTIPGLIAVLGYSGSIIFVFAGALAVGLLLGWAERTMLLATRNAVFAAVGSVALANVLAQLNFPYLALIFAAQLAVATAVVALLQRRSTRA